ncbi:MAG: phosphoribosylanthranilate isomerase, partial [Chlorobium sp.]|nr:phosphoribosylanthranilate isomerase [Chlorobium sp.]
MTRTKICGITRLTDALQASSQGADALGFNFSRKSPRSITPASAKKIIDELPPFVSKVGVFVEHSPEEIVDICSYSGIAIAQLHSDHYSAADARFLKD